MELEKSYNAKEAESKHYQRWEAQGCFAPEINQNPDAKPFSIVIPPPNVTGSLHMGHALQHTIMDVLTRWKRMQGFKTLWLPGTDHAGISVQRKVVEQLGRDERKKPQDIGREAFTERAWAWKEQFGNTICEQMRREGASVDWSRERFTMDESLSKAVREVFCTLYEEGSIYRGKRMINWCPNDKTVISDLEVGEEKKKGKLTYLIYPIEGSDKTLTVATTRPETMLGDTAVAVNPNDERYQDIIGKFVLLPLTNRKIPIIADEYVDLEFGTGCVKITPAHDPNDYEIGLRHNLEQILILNNDGTLNENAGAEFAGMDRFKARAKVIEDFEKLELLEKQDDYEITLPVCERCKTVIEPMVSEQWFCKMDGMRDLALDLMKNENLPHFSPQVPHEKVYTAWLENLKDWTISRQLWWGHQIPAWYDEDGNTFVARTYEDAKAQANSTNLTQDEDVLDTWFSSALWAFSTFGWNGEVTETEDLNTFCPTDVLVTGRDIIFLWVSRMMMTTKKFVDKTAFKDVIITGTVLGKDGKPMSKSRKNGVDPLEMFDKYGVDATRIYLASIASGADIRWNDLQIETYRNFANKIWNATRFCLLNSEGASVDTSSLLLSKNDSIADRWIISRLIRTANAVNTALERYHFHEAVRLLYQFFWNDLCDWYIELAKDEITQQSAVSNQQSAKARTRMLTIIEQSLRLLHPFMPYLTEELWSFLPATGSHLHNSAYSNADATIMLADYPKEGVGKWRNRQIWKRAETEMQSVIDLISRVRNIRAELSIKPAEKVEIHAACNADLQQVFRENEAQILKLARANTLTLGETLNVPKASAKAVMQGAEIAVPLEGLIDFAKERERLENQINKLNVELQQLNGQLNNENFVAKAPVEKVQDLRDRVAEIETQTQTLNKTIEALK
jgi:valyl-tRNA synthetase